MKKALFILALLIGALVMMPPDEAFADYRFIDCGGNAGVASSVTSCEFAQNVRTSYFVNGGTQFLAYSPVTQTTYVVNCSTRGQRLTFNDGHVHFGMICYAGTGAVVVFW